MDQKLISQKFPSLINPKVFCIAANLVLAGASQANAGPDDVTNRFLNEPATMMDVGVMRLELAVGELPFSSRFGVYFDWDRNLVVVANWIHQSEYPDKTYTELCDDWFQSLRDRAGVNNRTGKLADPDKNITYFASLFTHPGFDIKVDGKNLSEVAVELDKKIWFELNWKSSFFGGSDVRTAVCSGPLLDQGYSVKLEEW